MTPAIARLTDSEPILRRRCGWCVDRAPIDGLGPVPPGVPVSDGLCAACESKLQAQMDAHEASR